jgi:hypothetical protein
MIGSGIDCPLQHAKKEEEILITFVAWLVVEWRCGLNRSLLDWLADETLEMRRDC